MKALRQLPWPLALAVVVIVGQTLALFALGPSLTTATSIALAVLVVAFILRGSRFAWVVALTGASGQLVSSVVSTGDVWALAVGGIIAVCLLAPPAVRFVWIERSNRRAGRMQLAVKSFYERAKASAYGLLARVAGWDREEFGIGTTHTQRSYGVLIWRLGVGCVLLLVLLGLIHEWREGSGGDAPIVNIIASVTWTFYTLVQLTFVVVSIMALYRYFTTLRAFRRSSRSKLK